MRIRIRLTLTLTLFITVYVFGQKTDTLKFYSTAFSSERTIYITTPEFYKYQSENVKLPVIFLLDGQHEWFVNPVVNSIHYLQYTHQMPQAIIVTIPLTNRNKECGITSLEGEELPLYQFLIKEVDEKIQQYHPNNYKILIGHSFSASFSLYAYLKNPTYFSAVLANSPYDSFRELILAFETNQNILKQNIYISIGGEAKHEDYYHRKQFDNLQKEFPAFFNSIQFFVAEHAGHTTVPIPSTPNLLTTLFTKFYGRYAEIAMVDSDYKIITKPESLEGEILKINNASKIANYFYPPEIAELNGLASKYWSSDLNNYAIAMYEMGVKYYPDYYEFHFYLYELLLQIDKGRSKEHLNRAEELLNTVEINLSDKQNILNEISNEKIKNGW